MMTHPTDIATLVQDAFLNLSSGSITNWEPVPELAMYIELLADSADSVLLFSMRAGATEGEREVLLITNSHLASWRFGRREDDKGTFYVAGPTVPLGNITSVEFNEASSAVRDRYGRVLQIEPTVVLNTANSDPVQIGGDGFPWKFPRDMDGAASMRKLLRLLLGVS